MSADSTIRLLLLGDTHLGFDLPQRARVERPRRGEDFFANFERALEPAHRGEVDLVVHGGDLFFRSKIGAALASRGFQPLLDVATAGVPVFLVPGNHERGAMPRGLLLRHENLHLFDRPRTVSLDVRGKRIAISGFPSCRDTIRDDFAQLLRATDYEAEAAEVRVLCMHQSVEGATVGPSNYVFRRGADVVAGAQLPSGFAAFLCGHIHRQQTLTHDLRGEPLSAPVVYAGSIERTSSAEREEAKGYLVLELTAGPPDGGQVVASRFEPLPTRPMHEVQLQVAGRPLAELRREVEARLAALPSNSVVRLRIDDKPSAEAAALFSAASLRELAPGNIVLSLSGDWVRRQRRPARRR